MTPAPGGEGSVPLVRPAEPGDEAGLVALWRACGLTIPENDPAADFRFAQAGPASAVLVAADPADPAGPPLASAMVGHDGHRGWLYYLAVDPAHRGRGLGRGMLAAAEAWLRARGVPKVQLLVRGANAGVVPFYEAAGYAVEPRTVMSRRL